jgi:hypothetical protein
MLALMASRFAGEGMRAVLENRWPQMPWSPLLLCGQSFRGKTFGFMGFVSLLRFSRNFAEVEARDVSLRLHSTG